MDTRTISKEDDAAMRVDRKVRELRELIRQLVPKGDDRAEALMGLAGVQSKVEKALFGASQAPAEKE